MPIKQYSQTKLKGIKDIGSFLNEEIRKAKQFTTFILPEGSYNAMEKIYCYDKTISIIGGGGHPGLFTTIWTYHQEAGIEITRKEIGSTFRMQNISIGGAGNQKSPDQHGVVLRVPSTVKDCLIENFGGNGLDLHGEASAGTDVSFSEISKVVIRSCGGDGIYIRGGDANACTFYMIDVRDCKGWGINDASFLGNTYVSCMAHLNGVDTWLLEKKDWKGNYTASDINNRSTFLACYSEGGSPPSVFAGASHVAGGLIGYNRFELRSYATAITDGADFEGRSGKILQAPYDRTESYIKEYMGYYPTSLEAKNYK